jgi:arginine deiminase
MTLRISPGNVPADLGVQDSRGVPAALAEAFDAGPVKMLIADVDRGSALREHGNGAENYLAIAPGVVMGYDRNAVTNAMLRRNGIDVVTLAGSELGRGRGGARGMCCPVRRRPLWATGALS